MEPQDLTRKDAKDERHTVANVAHGMHFLDLIEKSLPAESDGDQ